MYSVAFKRVHLSTKTISRLSSLVRPSSNIIRSRFPDLVIPKVTLPEFVFADFSKFPNKTAVECAESGRKYTFEEIRRKSITLNKGIRKVLKLKHNDVVAIILPNIPEYPICLLGSLLANLRVTTVNPAGTVEEQAKQLIDADAKAIFTTCSLENHVRLVVKNLTTPISIIAIKTKVTDTTPQEFINFNELCDGNFDIDDKSLVGHDDVAIIPYSSGTTGMQKGVLHTHSSLVSLTTQLCSPQVGFTLPTTDNFQEAAPAVLPFFHIYGLTVLLISQLAVLTKMVTVPKFTPEIFLNVLENHKPRVMCAVPPLVLFLTNNPSVKKKHVESLETIVSGAAPLGSSDEERLANKFGTKTVVTQGYGLTEAPVLLINMNNDHVSPGSVGKPLQNTELKVMPSESNSFTALGPYEEGEIFARGPQVMRGYLNKPKETAETFVDGWLKTGDLGYFDKYNNVHIKDRLKELIKVQGYQVAPAELEELLRGYPNVSDAVVIGIPHDKFGEVPRAYISLKSKDGIDLKKLEVFVAEKVSKYKQIQGGFSIVDSIPKTASGKYLRKDLRMQYLRHKI